MYEKTLTIIFITSILSLLSACLPTISENGKPSSLAPTPFLMGSLPQGEDNYSQGFRDGCYNASGQNGFGFVRLFDKAPRASGKLYMNNLYRRGYRDGDRQCSVYVNRDIIL